MPGKRSLHIAWVGFVPGEIGGVPGVAVDLLTGLAALGHRIDFFVPAAERDAPGALADVENLTFVWGTSRWRRNRWYSRNRAMGMASMLLARSLASLRLRRQFARRHALDPYDVIYQFANIENLAVPPRLRREVPLVSHPETHSAGELRFLIKERRLALRSKPSYVFAIAAATLWLRMLLQRRSIRRASLLVCISSVFRDHLVRDYRFPAEATVVVPNSVELDRFTPVDRQLRDVPTILVLGRIVVRKGVDDVVTLARLLLDRNVGVRFRIVGGPSLWSDYTKLLEDLPRENSEYVGRLPASQIPGELARGDLLLQPSKYEPFALTVGEALATGMPVIGTSEVGAIEGVDRTVAAEVAPGDVEGMASAVTEMLDRLSSHPAEVRSLARSEAERLFAPEVVCRQISAALEQLVERGTRTARVTAPTP